MVSPPRDRPMAWSSGSPAAFGRAQAEAEELRGRPESDVANRVVIDLAHYAAVADRLRQDPTHEDQERESE